jgi:hypothetical protein
VADAEQLTAWLAEHLAERERRPERVRDALLVRCRGERIEPPAPARIERIVRSALHASEEALAARVTSRLSDDARQRIAALLDAEDDAIGPGDVDVEGEHAVLGRIKRAPGNVSLDTMLTEIDNGSAGRGVYRRGRGPVWKRQVVVCARRLGGRHPRVARKRRGARTSPPECSWLQSQRHGRSRFSMQLTLAAALRGVTHRGGYGEDRSREIEGFLWG